METSPRTLGFEAAGPVALKEQVAARIAAHRSRRKQAPVALPKLSLGMPTGVESKSARVAAAVAERYARSLSYREFLASEAEAAIELAQQAEAAAEVAARNAQAVAVAQTQLLVELQQWTQETRETIEIPVLDEAVSVEPSIESAVTVEPTMAAAIAADDAKMVTALRSHREVAGWDAAAVEAEMFVPAETPTALPANLLEFPRVLVAARKARPRLAEGPLRDEADQSPEQAQLRIFEVDAKAVSAEPVVESVVPVWSTIRLDAHKAAPVAEPASPQMSFALPPQTALLRRRVMAGAVDAAIVVAAFGVFAGVFVELTKVVPKGPVAAGAAVGIFFVLGLTYQVLCFTLGTATAGMRAARIGLCTFGDENPTQKAMRRRVAAMLLSAAPLGLGYLWAWLDDDRLGWHDRISRMYQRSY